MMTSKQEDAKIFRQFEKDIDRAIAKLSQKKSCENFGQNEIRAIKDKYSDHLHGNWSVVEPFARRLRQFEDWCDNYQNF